MNEELQKQALDMLQVLADKLGTTIDKILEIMVTQAYVQAIIALAIVSILWAVTVVFLFYIRKMYQLRASVKIPEEKGKYNYDVMFWVGRRGDYGTPYVEFTEGGMVLVIASCVVLLIALIVTFSVASTVITGFVNPEYWALKEILRLI